MNYEKYNSFSGWGDGAMYASFPKLDDEYKATEEMKQYWLGKHQVQLKDLVPVYLSNSTKWRLIFSWICFASGKSDVSVYRIKFNKKENKKFLGNLPIPEWEIPELQKKNPSLCEYRLTPETTVEYGNFSECIEVLNFATPTKVLIKKISGRGMRRKIEHFDKEIAPKDLFFKVNKNTYYSLNGTVKIIGVTINPYLHGSLDNVDQIIQTTIEESINELMDSNVYIAMDDVEYVYEAPSKYFLIGRNNAKVTRINIFEQAKKINF